MTAILIAALWVAFAATHMGLSSQGLRPRLVAKLGAQGFLGIYSLVALALFVPLVWTYFAHQHAGPHLWYLGHQLGLRWVMYVGMAAALVLVVGGLLTPSPAGMIPGQPEPRGVLRITRHPLFMGFGVFGALHLLVANVNAAELAFFGGFPLFAVLGCRHQDQRKLAGNAGYRRFCEATAFLPFAHPGEALRGLREMPLPVVGGVLLAFALRWVHPGWFGGAP